MVNSKQKGSRGEREWAEVCRQYGYTESRRTQQYCGDAGDSDVVGIPGIFQEVKRVENLHIHKAIEKAEENAPEDEIPIVAYRKNRKPWLVIMSAANFFKILKGGVDD